MADVKELSSIIQINNEEYKIVAETAKKVAVPLTIKVVNGNTATYKYDGSSDPEIEIQTVKEAEQLINSLTIKETGKSDTVFNGSESSELDLTPYAKKGDLFSKNYNDLTNKPAIPTKVSDLTNDSGFKATDGYHTSGSWSGLTYTATSVDGAGELKFTVPTGTSATTVAVGNHTHAYIPTSQKGAVNGVAELDATGKVPSSQLPAFVDDVIEGTLTNNTTFTPSNTVDNNDDLNQSGKIYVDTTSGKTYRWGGSAYVEISASLTLGETSSTAYRGDRGKIAYDHSQTAHAPVDAEKNVQSDWSVTDSASDAFIKNKPTIPKITVSREDPSSGATGDIWFKY